MQCQHWLKFYCNIFVYFSKSSDFVSKYLPTKLEFSIKSGNFEEGIQNTFDIWFKWKSKTKLKFLSLSSFSFLFCTNKLNRVLTLTRVHGKQGKLFNRKTAHLSGDTTMKLNVPLGHTIRPQRRTTTFSPRGKTKWRHEADFHRGIHLMKSSSRFVPECNWLRLSLRF